MNKQFPRSGQEAIRGSFAVSPKLLLVLNKETRRPITWLCSELTPPPPHHQWHSFCNFSNSVNDIQDTSHKSERDNKVLPAITSDTVCNRNAPLYTSSSHEVWPINDLFRPHVRTWAIGTSALCSPPFLVPIPPSFIRYLCSFTTSSSSYLPHRLPRLCSA
jgi:hypothetical protein